MIICFLLITKQPSSQCILYRQCKDNSYTGKLALTEREQTTNPINYIQSCTNMYTVHMHQHKIILH